MKNKDFITLVCGFGRCGTSLVQQMIKAGGGLPMPYDGIAHEDVRVFDLPDEHEWLNDMGGRSIKLIDPQNWQPPKGYVFKAVWIDRNHKQQAKSQVKFLREIAGINVDKGAISRFAKSYKKDRPLALKVINERCIEVLCLKFEDLIARPSEASEQLKSFLSLPKSNESMSSVVVPRDSRCYDGFLETALIEREEAANTP